ncbi:DUF885 family protein [Sediminibacterium roseum]|nr:DUF885 family protein [Sediminibacterium roseum]
MKQKIAGLCLLLAVCMGLRLSAQAPNARLYSQTSEMHDMMVQYNADLGNITRFYATNANTGFGGFGGRGGGQGNTYNSPERRARMQKLIASYEKKMDAVNFDKISVYAKVDYILFKRILDDSKDKLKTEDENYAKIAGYMPFAEKVYELERPRRRGLNVNGEQVAKQMNEIIKQVVAAKDALKKEGTIDIKLTNLGGEAIRSLQGSLKNAFEFYNGYDPMYTWWVPRTYSDLDSTLSSFAAVLRSKGKDLSPKPKDDGSTIPGIAVGRDELVRQLALEYIPYTPEELIAIAEKEFAYCDAELLKASREMGFGDKWKDAQEKVKNSFLPPGQQPQEMYELYKQSVEFLRKNDMVTIPELSEETWRMVMMTPERQLVNPFFTGGETLSISYPTNTMGYDEKMMSMRGNVPAFSRATVHHELIAGHWLQAYMAQRNKTYRRDLLNTNTPFWGEGSALYYELLLWDMKFPRTPEERIGMLFWRMHRCARIMFSLNFHLGKWTTQQSVDFLVDRVGFERANAEGEVRRSFNGSYPPLYQLAYMTGGMQLYALKKELVDSKKMTLKQYNDAIYSEGSMPIELLRVILTDQKITKDFKTNWRFYDIKK